MYNYYTQDGLGSVRTLTDSSGTVKNNYDYEAFGSAYSPNTTSTIEQRYTYTSQELDAASGLMYYNYRHYDTAIGRFGQRDPIYYAGGVNLYGYVSSSPVRFVDTFGLKPPDCDDERSAWKRAEARTAAERTLWKIASKTKQEAESDFWAASGRLDTAFTSHDRLEIIAAESAKDTARQFYDLAKKKEKIAYDELKEAREKELGAYRIYLSCKSMARFRAEGEAAAHSACCYCVAACWVRLGRDSARDEVVAAATEKALVSKAVGLAEGAAKTCKIGLKRLSIVLLIAGVAEAGYCTYECTNE